MTARMTIVTLAAELGVAPSTVSRAFTRPELLTAATVDRVRKAAQEAGYVPNNHARALITGRAGAIGIIVPDIANPFFPPIIRAAQGFADDAGLAVFVADSDGDPARELRIIEKMAPQVEGLIVASSRLSPQSLRALSLNHALVLINRDIASTARVLIDTTMAITAAVDRFAADGHREIAYVGGPGLSWSHRQRQKAVEDATAKRGIRATFFQADAGTYDQAFKICRSVIASGCTAVIAFDDVIAHGLMSGFTAHDLRVPGDVSIVVFYHTLAITTHPPLSTIKVDLARIARAAVLALQESRADRSVVSSRVEFEASLVLRGTTGPAPASRPPSAGFASRQPPAGLGEVGLKMSGPTNPGRVIGPSPGFHR